MDRLKARDEGLKLSGFEIVERGGVVDGSAGVSQSRLD